MADRIGGEIAVGDRDRRIARLQRATIDAVSPRLTELSPRMLESRWRSFMVGPFGKELVGI
jgi:hypothetical protein